MSVPIFVTCRDRVDCLRLLLDRLDSMAEIGPVILVDNDSAWPPMVEYLATTPHEVVRLGENVGHRAVWDRDIHASLRQGGPFVVTDPDVIPDAECPADAISRLSVLLDEYPSVVKVGLGLRIDDLPEGHSRIDDVRDWESQFWEDEIAPGVFDADIDTTFALYRAGAGPDLRPAIRTGSPYRALHLPWYADPETPNPEEIFYRARARPDSTNWHLETLQPPLAAALERRRRKLRAQPDHPLLDAWAAESVLVDEREFSAWAEPGWGAWSAVSAEREFCEFAGLLTRMLDPRVVLETGIGEGYSTRRIAQAMGDRTHLCFESDPGLRTALAALPLFVGQHRILSSEPTPSAADLAGADLTVLDSDLSVRHTELAAWRASARAGSVVLVHDCGSDFPDDSPQAQLRQMVDELDVAGTFFRNPRGAFVGVHPGSEGPNALRAASQELGEVRDELDRMRATRSWKVTRPLRAVHRLRLLARRQERS